MKDKLTKNSDCKKTTIFLKVCGEARKEFIYSGYEHASSAPTPISGMAFPPLPNKKYFVVIARGELRVDVGSDPRPRKAPGEVQPHLPSALEPLGAGAPDTPEKEVCGLRVCTLGSRGLKRSELEKCHLAH